MTHFILIIFAFCVFLRPCIPKLGEVFVINCYKCSAKKGDYSTCPSEKYAVDCSTHASVSHLIPNTCATVYDNVSHTRGCYYYFSGPNCFDDMDLTVFYKGNIGSSKGRRCICRTDLCNNEKVFVEGQANCSWNMYFEPFLSIFVIMHYIVNMF